MPVEFGRGAGRSYQGPEGDYDVKAENPQDLWVPGHALLAVGGKETRGSTQQLGVSLWRAEAEAWVGLLLLC